MIRVGLGVANYRGLHAPRYTERKYADVVRELHEGAAQGETRQTADPFDFDAAIGGVGPDFNTDLGFFGLKVAAGVSY